MKLLLTSICKPIGPKYGDGPSVGYELLWGQVTRAQGIFSPRAKHEQYSLHYIATNLDTPTTVLQYPSKRQLIKELKKGYDYVGIAFILSTFHRMKEAVALVRKYAPDSKIVLGGYGTVASDEELAPYADHICRGEGVAFMRELLGEPPRPLPYEHPKIVSTLKIFSVPTSRTGMVFAGLGCPNGCDFCCTSHYFKRRHIRLLPTGKDIYDVLCRYQDDDPEIQFTVLDEDFILNRKRAMEYRELALKSGRKFSIFAFASIKALSQYTMTELVEMGIDGVWIGYEGTRSGYAKQQGRTPADLFPDLTRHGIQILASMIVGFDYQDRETVRQELRGLLRLRPAYSQFLIYGPTPGTPFYDRVVQENRLRPELNPDRQTYYRNCTGFTSMVTHPKLTRREIEDLQKMCFETDFQRLGPSFMRSIRIWLGGYENLRHSPNVAVRRKGLRLGAEARRGHVVYLASKLFAPNRRIRRWIASIEKRSYRLLGQPTLYEQLLSILAVGAALWTKFTLKFDLFQHPRIPVRRYNWEYLPQKLMRLWGEMRENGICSELKVTWEPPKLSGDWSWMKLEGILDGKNAEELSARMDEMLAAGRQRLVVSLESLQWIDRKASAAFYKALRKYRGRIRFELPKNKFSDLPDLKELADYFKKPAASESAA